MNVAEALRWASQRLGAAGVTEARLDAEILLGCVLGVARATLFAHPERELAPAQVARFRRLVRRRARRAPVQYLTGTREFMSLEFLVRPGVFIPRPETEVLVEAVLEFLAGLDRGGLVVDVGAGSGAVAVSLARYSPATVVYATEISPEAVEVARRNARAHGVEDRVKVLGGDCLAPLAARGIRGKVDVVVSNPPYVPSADVPRLQTEVAAYEPRRALDGGPDGLDFYRRLAGECPPYLRPRGILAVEVAAGAAGAVESILRAGGGFDEFCTRKDYAGTARVVVARRGGGAGDAQGSWDHGRGR